MDSLLRYFETSLPNLEKDYRWPISKPLYGFSGDSYEENKCLKFHLHKLWKDADNDNTKRNTLAIEIVKDWGGIRSNKNGTIRKYVAWCQEYDENWDWPLQGVASYSKILAIKDPTRYAIYDARVAVALNAAQYIYEENSGIIFNYVPSRNKKIKRFLEHKEFKKPNLHKKNGWEKLPFKENYSKYIYILHSLEKKLRKSGLRDFPLYDLEMSLFANAEDLAKMAICKAEY